MWLIWVLLIALAIFIYCKVRKKFKTLSPLGTITVCTGAVKTGKTTLAVHLALKSYKKALRSWKIRSVFHPDEPKPHLYSNIPLACDYVPVTVDILLRRVKISPKSVMLLDEASLVADSQLIKEPEVNIQLLKFFKLYGHYSHGGTLVIDTQSISDLHYAIKRCINNYLYIQRTRSAFFFVIMDVLEQRYSDDGTVVSNQTDDVDVHLRRVILSRRCWRMFDTYCYSVMSDSLPTYEKEVAGACRADLKASQIPSFRNWSDIPTVEVKNNDKK